MKKTTTKLKEENVIKFVPTQVFDWVNDNVTRLRDGCGLRIGVVQKDFGNKRHTIMKNVCSIISCLEVEDDELAYCNAFVNSCCEHDSKRDVYCRTVDQLGLPSLEVQGRAFCVAALDDIRNVLGVNNKKKNMVGEVAALCDSAVVVNHGGVRVIVLSKRGKSVYLPFDAIPDEVVSIEKTTLPCGTVIDTNVTVYDLVDCKSLDGATAFGRITSDSKKDIVRGCGLCAKHSTRIANGCYSAYKPVNVYVSMLCALRYKLINGRHLRSSKPRRKLLLCALLLIMSALRSRQMIKSSAFYGKENLDSFVTRDSIKLMCDSYVKSSCVEDVKIMGLDHYAILAMRPAESFIDIQKGFSMHIGGEEKLTSDARQAQIGVVEKAAQRSTVGGEIAKSGELLIGVNTNGFPTLEFDVPTGVIRRVEWLIAGATCFHDFKGSAYSGAICSEICMYTIPRGWEGVDMIAPVCERYNYSQIVIRRPRLLLVEYEDVKQDDLYPFRPVSTVRKRSVPCVTSDPAGLVSFTGLMRDALDDDKVSPENAVLIAEKEMFEVSQTVVRVMKESIKRFSCYVSDDSRSALFSMISIASAENALFAFLQRIAALFGFSRNSIITACAKYATPSSIKLKNPNVTLDDRDVLEETLTDLCKAMKRPTSSDLIGLAKNTSSGRDSITIKATSDIRVLGASNSKGAVVMRKGMKATIKKKSAVIPLLGINVLNAKSIANLGSFSNEGSIGRRDDPGKTIPRLVFVIPVAALFLEVAIRDGIKAFQDMPSNSITFANAGPSVNKLMQVSKMFEIMARSGRLLVNDVTGGSTVFEMALLSDYPAWDQHMTAPIKAFNILLRTSSEYAPLREYEVDGASLGQALADMYGLSAVGKVFFEIRDRGSDKFVIKVISGTSGNGHTTVGNSIGHNIIGKVAARGFVRASDENIELRETEGSRIVFGDDGIKGVQIKVRDRSLLDDAVRRAIDIQVAASMKCGFEIDIADMSGYMTFGAFLQVFSRHGLVCRRWRALEDEHDSKEQTPYTVAPTAAGVLMSGSSLDGFYYASVLAMMITSKSQGVSKLDSIHELVAPLKNKACVPILPYLYPTYAASFSEMFVQTLPRKLSISVRHASQDMTIGDMVIDSALVDIKRSGTTLSSGKLVDLIPSAKRQAGLFAGVRLKAEYDANNSGVRINDKSAKIIGPYVYSRHVRKALSSSITMNVSSSRYGASVKRQTLNDYKFMDVDTQPIRREAFFNGTSVVFSDEAVFKLSIGKGRVFVSNMSDEIVFDRDLLEPVVSGPFCYLALQCVFGVTMSKVKESKSLSELLRTRDRFGSVTPETILDALSFATTYDEKKAILMKLGFTGEELQEILECSPLEFDFERKTDDLVAWASTPVDEMPLSSDLSLRIFNIMSALPLELGINVGASELLGTQADKGKEIISSLFHAIIVNAVTTSLVLTELAYMSVSKSDSCSLSMFFSDDIFDIGNVFGVSLVPDAHVIS